MSILGRVQLALILHSSINNILGPKLTLLIGTMGYSLYIGSYL